MRRIWLLGVWLLMACSFAQGPTLSVLWARGGLLTPPASVALDTTRDRLYVLSGGYVYEYRYSDQRLMRLAHLPDSTVRSFQLSRDGRLLALELSGRMRVVAIETWRVEYEVNLTGGVASDYAFSPDGQLLAIGLRNAIELRRASTGELVRILSWQGSTTRKLGFTPDSARVVVLDAGGRTRIWRLSDGVVERTLDFPDANTALDAAVSPDGQRLALALASGRAVRLYDLNTGALIFARSFSIAPWRVAFSPDGTLLASASEASGRVNLMRTSDGSLLYPEFTPHPTAFGSVNTLSFTDDGQFLLAGGTRDSEVPAISLWDVQQARHSRFIPTYSRPVFVAFDAEASRLLTCGENERVILAWDVATGEPAGTVLETSSSVRAFALHPRREWMVVEPASVGGIQLWRLPDATLWLTLPGGRVLGFAPDGSRIWATDAPFGAVSIWRLLADGVVLERFYGRANAFALDPGLRVTALAREGAIEIRDASTGALLRQRADAPSNLLTLLFTPSGEQLAYPDPNRQTLYLWAWQADHTRTLPLPAQLASFAFSPDGQFLLTMHRDGRLRCWRTRDLQLAWTLENALFREPLAPHFSPDGRYLAITRTDGSIAMLRNPVIPDANDDGAVDDSDLLTVLFNFGGVGTGDVNWDGVVDGFDLQLTLWYYGL